MDKATWAGIQMAFMYNKDHSDKLNGIKLKFYDFSRKLVVDKKVEELVALKDEIIGTTLVMFTDGQFGVDGNNRDMSMFKLITFCKLVGIKVYIIVLESIDQLLASYIKQTGGSAEVVSDINSRVLGPIYENIVKTNANQYVYKETRVDQSLAMWSGIFALSFFTLNLILKNTLVRNFTEI
jgi:hypothetical protein